MSPVSSPLRDDPLLDARTGIVTALESFEPGPHAPPGWVGASARLADTGRFGEFRADRYGFGAAIGDHARARLAALGEAVERYCGNAVPANLVRGSWHSLRARGHHALDPDSLSLYSAAQYATPGFPFTPMTRDSVQSWTPGRDMHTGADTFVPAAISYLNFFTDAHAHEPPTNSVCYAGIAAGPDRADAERSALEEIIERDATTLWWAAGGPALRVTGLDLDYDPALTIRMLWIPSQFAPPVLACFMEDHERAMISFGSACRADPYEAARKALVECYAMYELTGEVADPESALWEAAARGDFHPHTFRPYRADRAYHRDFRPDLRDMIDLPTLAQYYLDPRHQGAPLDRLRTDCGTIDIADLPHAGEAATPRHPRPDQLDVYLDDVAAHGLSAYSVDLTTADVAAAGRTVVRVVVPGTYGNAPAAFPYLGGTRLYEIPHRLGCTDRALTEQTLYPHPIPHV